MDNETLVFWKGRPVGIEIDGRIHWFTGAPREAMEAYR